MTILGKCRGLISFSRQDSNEDGMTHRVPPTLLSLTNWAMPHATRDRMQRIYDAGSATSSFSPVAGHPTVFASLHSHESFSQYLGTKPRRFNHSHTCRGPATTCACVQGIRNDCDPYPRCQNEQYTHTITTPFASLAETTQRRCVG